MADAISYEEMRRRQVEDNKRKLDELRLRHLSVAVQEAAAAAKPSPTKSQKRKARTAQEAGEAAAPLRRSGRVASLPEQPKYRDDSWDFGEKIRRTYSTRRDLSNRVYATDEERTYAITKAEELERKLGSDHPIFVKPMLQSHVTGGFWLGLPTLFSRKHLPRRDESISLVDEVDDEFETLYLAHKRGLSAGWRGFAIDHKLVDGDCLVFQLITRTKFKVYIIRANAYYKDDK